MGKPRSSLKEWGRFRRIASSAQNKKPSVSGGFFETSKD
jgi:hypothetical protein